MPCATPPEAVSEQRTIEALARRNAWLEDEVQRLINLNSDLADQLYRALRKHGER